MATDRILVLDFGSQTTQLIARRVREAGVYCEIHPFNEDLEKIKAFDPAGIVLSGGPASVYDDDAPMCADGVFELGLPLLGICYGMQAMTVRSGGRVEAGDHREFGRAHLEIDRHVGLFTGLEPVDNEQVWMSHGDKIIDLPQGFEVIAHSTNGVTAAVRHRDKPWFGVQFHPEVVHTPRGPEMIQHFVSDVCGCESTWNMKSFAERTIVRLREQIGTDKIICGLSGGVDSSVVAMLLHEAVGEQLHCVFVDNGLLRYREAEDVVRIFGDELGFNLTFVDASDRFLDQLAGVSDPEVKRKRIGHTFIDVFEDAAKEIQDVKYLAQGTLYPDVVESVSVRGGPSSMIKSHHNVGGLPDRLNFELVEPLRELFKDEVRAVGRELGLPEPVLMRQPFPGPGLAVRILGDITRDKVTTLQLADKITQEELARHDFVSEIWQSFTVLLPVKTVGVMGDHRTYENVAAVRAVSSLDGMTADWYPVPHSVLSVISSRIINEVRGINRVVYDISSKPPGTIEWE